MNNIQAIKKDLAKFANEEKREVYQRFFQTGKGQYGEGDAFIGITTPQMRSVAKKHFREASLEEIEALLKSEIHEHRSVALIMLTEKYQRLAKTKADKKEIYDFYLKHAKRANNWDLVDISCYKIVGPYILEYPEERRVLHQLAKSKNLWEQRISVISNIPLIKAGEFADILKISKKFLKHEHHLIHKAVGWMLREVGKRDRALLEKFLNDNLKDIPRVTLSYATERLGAEMRKRYLTR